MRYAMAAQYTMHTWPRDKTQKRSATFKIVQVDIKDLTEIGGARVLKYVILTPEIKRTGRTRHIIGGQEQTVFSGLAICKYEDAEGVYLFYCDSNWTELTDTWHEDVQSAKKQATFEFEGLGNKWNKK